MNKEANDPSLILSDKPAPRWLWIGCVLFVIASALMAASKSVGGGDTWVAMACGRYTLGDWENPADEHPAERQENRTWQMKVLDLFGIHVTQVDPFGAKSRAFQPESPGRIGWVNQNWLTHIVFYKLRDVFGENSIVVYKFIQAILTALFAYWAGRVLGAHPMLAAAAAAFGMLLSRSFIDLRPNVSSILFAVIMIYLLARWRRGEHKALIWMIPVTIIWCNVHGGFIYAIMVFGILLGAHLVQFAFQAAWPSRFVEIGKRGYIFLLAGTAAVILIPAIFSPYGFENLIHPFIIATSEDGDKWRNVIEWKPIYEFGFGNEDPYIWFLSILGGLFVIWLILFFFKPARPVVPKGRHAQDAEEAPWPKIDLAFLGVMAITIAMSIKSRRFIFLGGLVLAPFVAQLAQDVINMIVILSRRKSDASQWPQISAALRLPLAGLSLVAAVVMGGIYVYAMNELYFKPHRDGQQLTVFRRMVGIDDQPVKAIKFFDANQIKGVVLNEWTNGGFVPFWQTPNRETGEPPCKVYMDGRAQAAYDVSHFERSNTIRHKLPKARSRVKKAIRQLAEQKKINPKDPRMCQKLVKIAQTDKALWNRLQSLAHGDPQLWLAVCDHELTLLRKQAGLSEQTANWPGKLLRRYRGDPERYNALLSRSVNNQQLYEQILLDEGLNVLLLSFKHSQYLIDFMMAARTWRLIYIDDRYAIFLRKEKRWNPELADQPLEAFHFPAEIADFARNYTLGYADCMSGDGRRMAQGLDTLMQIEKLDLRLLQTIYGTGFRLQQFDKLYEFFSERYQQYKKQVDADERFTRWKNMNALMVCGQYLQRLAAGKKQTEQAALYANELKHYEKMLKGIHAEMSKGWYQ